VGMVVRHGAKVIGFYEWENERGFNAIPSGFLLFFLSLYYNRPLAKLT